MPCDAAARTAGAHSLELNYNIMPPPVSLVRPARAGKALKTRPARSRAPQCEREAAAARVPDARERLLPSMPSMPASHPIHPSTAERRRNGSIQTLFCTHSVCQLFRTHIIATHVILLRLGAQRLARRLVLVLELLLPLLLAALLVN